MSSLIDRWMEKLSTDTKSQTEGVKLLLEKLRENYRDELILAKKLAMEAERLPYLHLTDEAMKLVKEKHEFADFIAKLVTEAGGTVDRSEADGYAADSTGQFTQVLKMETDLGERFVEQLNIAEDCGASEIAKKLIWLKGNHDRHQEAIERLIMKINAAL